MASLDELLMGLNLDQGELQKRLQRLFLFTELITRADEPQSIDGFVPSAAFTDGTPQLMPFRRSPAGWAMLQTADPAGAELTYSLDRLPYGAVVTGAKLNYITDATFPDSTNLFGLYMYDRRSGVFASQKTVPITTSDTVRSLELAFPWPITVGLSAAELLVAVTVTDAVNGASLFVRGLYLTYSYLKSARP